MLPATTGADAERQAAEAVAAGTGAVVAVGGDGTAHAALQAVAGTTTPLAVVPAGTGNDLALALGIPRDPVAAARAAAEDLVAGDVRTIDAGRTGDRWWATVLCCGFDSAVTDRANRLRWPRGRRRYDVAILAELARLRPRELVLVLDGESQTLPVTLVAVGNTSWYGGGMKVCPGADPADGLFDVTVVGPLTRLAAGAAPAAADRRHARRERRGHRATGRRGWSSPRPASPPTPTASRWPRCPRSPSACPARCGSSAPPAPDPSPMIR